MISVVIPTHNRRVSVIRTLKALSSQTAPSNGYEVIVVADACTDDTVQAVSGKPWPFSFSVLETDGGSAGKARQRGAAEAVGDILLFLDDDVEPCRELVAEHEAFHGAGAAAHPQIALGPYFPAQQGRADFYRMLVRAWWEDLFFAMGQPGHRFTYKDFVTGNVSLPRSVFLEIGGFDEAFRDCGGEDWEFGIRALKRGHRFAYLPKALATHHDHEASDLDRSLKRARQEGISDVLIAQRHPELVRTLDISRLARRRPALWKLVPWTAIRLPWLGDLGASVLRLLLRPLEGLRWRQTWRTGYGALRWYWYWRGVGIKSKGWASLVKLVRRPDAEGGVGLLDAATGHGGGLGAKGLRAPTLEIDLDQGIEAAVQAVEKMRPASVRVMRDGREVAVIPHQPGAEPLRGHHLRGILAGHLWSEVVKEMEVPA